MKANEAPENIYLHIRPNKEIGSTWHGNKISDTDIEYTRTDAFIEKAWDWIENNIFSPNQQDESFLYYEQFKNYMKGESGYGR